MNVQDLLAHHEHISIRALDLMEAKNNDYAGGSGETPFRNFSRAEDLGICSTEQGILVRITDKLSRLSTYAEGTSMQVSDETFDDTVVDLINYAIILSAYCKYKRKLVIEQIARGKTISNEGEE